MQATILKGEQTISEKIVQLNEKVIKAATERICTVSEIAQHFYYSREYVSRIFKQYYNLQLSEYLVNRKVDYAKNLLKEGKSVTFAFDSSGFHSMSSFINAFRSRTSMTPSEYKRSKKK